MQIMPVNNPARLMPKHPTMSGTAAATARVIAPHRTAMSGRQRISRGNASVPTIIAQATAE